jgi:hypothetical protein
MPAPAFPIEDLPPREALQRNNGAIGSNRVASLDRLDLLPKPIARLFESHSIEAAPRNLNLRKSGSLFPNEATKWPATGSPTIAILG